MSLFPRLATLLAIGCLIAGCPPGQDDDDAVQECDPVAGDSAPTVDIQDPANSLELDADDPVNWVVHVDDEDSEVTDSTVWAVDMSGGTEADLAGGDFDIPSPDADGRVVFSMPQPDTLGAGVITIRIWAEDSIGCSSNDQVVLCVDVDSAICPSR
jgi:hypothetical protein